MNSKSRFTSRSIQGVVITIFLVLFLGTSITVFLDTYNRTLEENRKRTYGSWHIAIYEANDTAAKVLSDHAAVNSVGTMHLSGMVMANESMMIGGVGCIDESLAEIGNITLLDGHFPSTSDEIAMEAAVLNRLGYSLVLGQKIQLSISCFDAYGQLQAPMTHAFTLTGVIKNYSNNWKSNSHWLVSCCVSKSFIENTQSKVHVFGQLDSAFMRHADSLKPLFSNEGIFIKNDYTYLQYSENASADTGSITLRTVIILSGCLSMIVLINNEITKKQVCFVTMRVLGATKKQIVVLFLKKRIWMVFLAGCSGIAFGILFPYIVAAFASNILKITLYYQLTLIHILKFSLLSFLCLGFSLCLSIIRIFNMPLIGRVDQQVAKHPKKYRRNQLNRKNLQKVLDYPNRGKRWMSFALTFTSTVLIIFAAYDAWTVYKDYSIFSYQHPQDYSFGMIASYHNPPGHLSESELDLIRGMYGVEQVQAFSVSDYVAVSFLCPYDEEYAEAAKRSIQKSIADLPSANICGTIVGITDSLIPLYLRESNSSSVVLQDNEVILYVPDLYCNGNDVQLLNLSQNKGNAGVIIHEDVINTGQKLVVDTGKTQAELSVAGIIHAFSSDMATSFKLIRPFSMICNEKTYVQMFGQCQYTYVLVYGDSTTVQYQTDVELSKIQTELNFSNNRLFKSDQLFTFTTKLFLSMITLIASTALSVMIHCGIQSQFSSLERQKQMILYRLGMSKRKMVLSFVIRSVRESFLGAFAALPLFIAYRCYQENNRLFLVTDYPKGGLFHIAFDVMSRCIYQTSWGFVFMVILFIVLLNSITLMFYDNRFNLTEKQIDDYSRKVP